AEAWMDGMEAEAVRPGAVQAEAGVQAHAVEAKAIEAEAIEAGVGIEAVQAEAVEAGEAEAAGAEAGETETAHAVPVVVDALEIGGVRQVELVRSECLAVEDRVALVEE